MPEDKRKAYERFLEAKTSERDVINTARDEGFEEGKIDIAKKMIAKSMDISFVVEMTGLSEEQILKLKSKSS